MLNINQLTKQQESEILEFKTSTSEKKKIVQTVSAFCNKRGGAILIGISPQNKIVGVNIGKKTIEDLANYIKENTDPKIYPLIKVKEVKKEKIIVIKIEENKEKPVFAFNIAYKRVGKTNQKISSREIQRLARSSQGIHWDEQICKKAKLSNIDKEKVRLFLKKAKKERKHDIQPDIKTKEALKKLELIKENQLTNASILLFGKNPQKFFHQAELRCARFKGTTTTEFIDMKVLKGTIIEQRIKTMEFIKEHIKLHAKIVEDKRVETWEYPLEAIREAVTNAICHRDYRMSSNAQIRIFDDRLEVWGCGPLPDPLTIEDLRKEHESIPRNPLIANCFFRIKFIEKWGTGTNRIIKQCLKHNLPEPSFKIAGGSFVIVFKKYRITKEIFKELSDRQKKIVNYLKKHQKITRKEATNVLNVSKNTAFRELDNLQEKGLIKRKGQGRETHYELN